MSRMLDLIRASALPSHQMMSASRGALHVPASEMIEILVYLAEHNKIFGEQARLTLAGWDETSAQAIASDPKTPKEVLDYWLSPKNLRSALVPLLLENDSVPLGKLAELATALEGESVSEGHVRGPINSISSGNTIRDGSWCSEYRDGCGDFRIYSNNRKS